MAYKYLNIIIGIIINSCLLSNIGIAQNGGSLELSFNTANFWESNFLDNSSFKRELFNPLLNNEESEVSSGLVAYKKGKNRAINFRYLKSIKSNTEIVVKGSFNEQSEQVLAVCLLGDICQRMEMKHKPSIALKAKSIDLGIGARYQLASWKKFAFLVESIISMSKVINESGFFSYNVQFISLIHYSINHVFEVNIKYERKKSYKDYRYAHEAIEFGVSKSI